MGFGLVLAAHKRKMHLGHAGVGDENGIYF